MCSAHAQLPYSRHGQQHGQTLRQKVVIKVRVVHARCSSGGADLRCTATHAGCEIYADDSAEHPVRSPSLSSRQCTVSDRERTELLSSLSAQSELVDVSLFGE